MFVERTESVLMVFALTGGAGGGMNEEMNEC